MPRKSRDIEDVQKSILDAYGRLRNWREVGLEFDLPGRTVHRIAKRGYIPRRKDILDKLGLPVLALAPTCPRCGCVHVSKRCPAQPGNHRRLWNMPPGVLRWKLDNREEFTGE